MHSLSVLKCMGAHPLAGRALLHLTSLRLNGGYTRHTALGASREKVNPDPRLDSPRHTPGS